MAQIETIYRARVDFDAEDTEVIDAIVDRALKLGRGLDECEGMLGNPACYPYVQGESSNLREVKAWAAKVERYVIRRKGGRLNPEAK